METITQNHKTFCLKNIFKGPGLGWYGEREELIHLAQEFYSLEDAQTECEKINDQLQDGNTRYEVFVKTVKTDANRASEIDFTSSAESSDTGNGNEPGGHRAPWDM